MRRGFVIGLLAAIAAAFVSIGLAHAGGYGGGGAASTTTATSDTGALWPAPASPDSRDEEFTGTAFTGWTQSGTWVTTAFDPYTAYTTSGETRYSWNSYRAGWLFAQPAAQAGTTTAIQKAVAYATNTQVWARVQSQNAGSNAADNGIVALEMTQTSGGVVDTNNRVLVSTRSNIGNTQEVRIEKVVGGSVTSVATAVTSTTQFGAPEYLLLQKAGTNFTAWYASANGQWTLLATTSAAVTPDRFRVQFTTSATKTFTPGGPPIVGVDFVRFRDVTALPRRALRPLVERRPHRHRSEVPRRVVGARQ